MNLQINLMNGKKKMLKFILIIIICLCLTGCAYQEIKTIKPDNTVIESKVWTFGVPVIY